MNRRPCDRSESGHVEPGVLELLGARHVQPERRDRVSLELTIIKGRLLGALTWQHHFFGEYATSVSAFYDGHSGPAVQLHVRQRRERRRRFEQRSAVHFRSPDRCSFVQGTPQSVIDQFYKFINNNDYLKNHAGGPAGQNGATSPWINQINLSFRQEIPGFFKGNKGEIRFDILNFGNLLNKDWGVIYDVPFATAGGFSRPLANFRGIDPATGSSSMRCRRAMATTTRRCSSGKMRMRSRGGRVGDGSLYVLRFLFLGIGAGWH